MRKYIRGLNTSWVLLFTYAAFFILLVISRNHQFWNQRKASSLLVKTVQQAHERQKIFSDLYNAELEQEMAFSKLTYSYADYTTGDLKAIMSLVKNDDSLFAASEKYISGNDEHELFERLK